MEYNVFELLNNPTPDNDFNEQLRNLRLEAICGRPYIRVGRLQQWLRRKNPPETGISEFHRLLKRVYSNRDDWLHCSPLLSQDPNAQGASERLDLVFSILYILGQPKLLYYFKQLDITDNNLPMPLTTLNQKLVHQAKLDNGAEIAKMFDCLQWSFAPKILEIRDSRVEKQRIIPIHRRRALKLKEGRPIQRGGTSNLYIIEILEEFLSEKVKSYIPFSRYCPVTDALGPRYQIVMKSFVNGCDSYYDNEVRNLSTLGHANTKGVVRYLGSFRHAGWSAYEPEHLSFGAAISRDAINDTTSCHILFEYGEGDLLDFFERAPPAHHAEIRLFWEDLFRVANALEEIHDLKIRVDETSELASAIHGDLKPENIISVQKQLKLADLGFSRVMHKVHGQKTSAIIDGITKPYAAPECLQNGGSLPQSIDIWSLGCVFSLAATWIVRGYDGYEDFAGLRKHAVERILKRQKESGETSRLVIASFFHDGYNVLPEVIDWHNLLRSSLRISDEITGRVLDLVEKEMFVSDPYKRISAKKLVLELKSLVEQHINPSNEIPLRIKSYYDQLQNDVSIKAEQSERVQNTVEVKDSNYNKRLQVENHRLEYLTTISRVTRQAELPSALISQPEVSLPGGTIGGPSSSDQRISLLDQQQNIAPPDIEYSPVTHEDLSASYAMQIPQENIYAQSVTDTFARNRKKRQPARPENAWQARGRMHVAEVGTSALNKLISRVNPDDRLLAHYKDRDIIFLVDNQGTMSEFWFEVRWIFETLLKISRKIDKNGVDLFFTCSNFHVSGKNEDNILKAFDSQEVIPRPGIVTNMSQVLDSFFKRYLQSVDSHDQHRREAPSRKPSHRMRGLKSPKSKKADEEEIVRDATLIILTNGVWPNSKRGDFDKIFRSFIDGMNLRGRIIDSNIRSYSVEFVRFGEDTDAINLLEHLDDDLKFDGIEDIIDTEEARGGDVYKMMLGSFVPYYDSLDGPDPDGQLSTGTSLQHQLSSTQLQAFQALHYQTPSPDIGSSWHTGLPVRQASLRSPTRPSPGPPRYTVPPVSEQLPGQGPYHRAQVSLYQDPSFQVPRQMPTFDTMSSVEMLPTDPQHQQWREATASREWNRPGYTGPYPRQQYYQ